MPHPPARLQAKVGRSVVAGTFFRRPGLLIGLGVMTLSLVGGLACPGNIDPVFLMPGPTGGGGSGGGSVLPHCDDAPMLIKVKCGMTGGCHSAGNINAGGLDLLTDDPGARLLGIGAGGDYYGGVCGMGTVYLVPHTNPAQGLFVEKLTNPTCGEQMPELVSWNDANTQCLLDWAAGLTAP